MVATVLALLWANSPWKDAYHDLWATQVLGLDLQQWVSDGLMAIFFFVVGLEIKRELVVGELREPRRAALPVIAAAGGMVVPAAIYAGVNAGGVGSHGWGIPMATDIAMAVGVLALFGSRVSPSLKLFLLALAIVDDIGAILVIAIFYAHGVDGVYVAAAVAVVVAVLVLRRVGVHVWFVYVALGVGMWWALHEAGIHPTVAGVAMGLLTPARPGRGADRSEVERLEHVLHPWSSFVIVPLFALANAGIVVSASALSDAASSAISIGVVVGLVVGKLVGISAATMIAVRLRVGALPDGATRRGLVGVAALGGIGFTVSILIAGLAFTDAALVEQAKLGVLCASIMSALLGALILWRPRR